MERALAPEEAAADIVAPPGTRYDPRRQWVFPQGVVARNLAHHPMFPRPKKNASGKSYAVSFDELAGNTMLGLHMSRLQPGAHNRGHRHVDEAIMLVISGRGWSELRQSDDKPMQRVPWRAGSVFGIPANAWHQHFNDDPDAPARMLAFKDTQVLRRLFGSREFVYDNSFRFHDRYDDQPDYWTNRVSDRGLVHTGAIDDSSAEVLDPDPTRTGVSLVRFRLGGHRTLECAIVEVAPGAEIPAYSAGTEEAIAVLSGAGETTILGDAGKELTVGWSAGDLVSAPFGTVRSHRSVGDVPARVLMVRVRALEALLGASSDGFTLTQNARFPEIVEPDYSQLVDGLVD